MAPELAALKVAVFAVAILAPNELPREAATSESMVASLSLKIDTSVSSTMVESANEKPDVVSLLVITFAAVCEALSAFTPAEPSDSDATSRMFETDVLAALIFNAASISAALAPVAVAAAIGSKLVRSILASRSKACLI